MTDYTLGWQCPYCNSADYNALGLDRCASCQEIRPLEVRIEDVPTLTSKAPKNAKKGGKKGKTKGASKEAKQRGNKIAFDGFLFDSTIEYQRYLYLKDCCNQGMISYLRVHPTFQLAPPVKLPASFLPSKTQSAITYTPDFSYMVNGLEIYEDTKGAYGYSKKNIANKKAGKPIVTEAARLRHKLFIAKLAAQGIRFHFQLVTIATLEINHAQERKIA